jgi:hypothetical protein
MKNRTHPIALALAAGIAISALSLAAHACPTDASVKANSVATVDAFTQFSDTIKAEQQQTLDSLGGANVNTVLGGKGNARNAIVGFWKFAFVAQDGVHGIDWGFQSWHDDSTELTNSGGQLPATGNFCSGTWSQDPDGTYHLNHWAIAWNLPGTDPSDLAGLINISEVLRLDRSGNSMTGSVALDLYAPDTTTHLAHLVDGTVIGSRVKP